MLLGHAVDNSGHGSDRRAVQGSSTTVDQHASSRPDGRPDAGFLGDAFIALPRTLNGSLGVLHFGSGTIVGILEQSHNGKVTLARD